LPKLVQQQQSPPEEYTYWTKTPTEAFVPELAALPQELRTQPEV
jgi:hypothetical protein